MSKFVKTIKTSEIAPGGMKMVELEGLEIVICNVCGEFYAIQGRCGHMNAPLDKGTLDGKILTCAMHCAQFDLTTGEVLSGPVPIDLGGETPPPRLGKYLQDIGKLTLHIRTQSIRTYETKVESGLVLVAV